MATSRKRPFENLLVDHIGLYVSDIEKSTEWLVDGYGLAVYARSAEGHRVALGRRDIRLVLTAPGAADRAGTAFLARHGDGVADIALRVPDAVAAFEEAVRRGARPVSAPARRGGLVTAAILGFGDLRHTFVQRDGGPDSGSYSTDERALPGLHEVPVAGGFDAGLREVDHFAVCLPAGQLDPTVAFYQRVLDFDMIFTERIVIGSQAMDSKVVQSASGAVTFTVIEPDLTLQPGQIDDFLRSHGGAGIQHIAFTAADIVGAVGAISARGVDFLHTPASYYGQLPQRLELARHTVEDLQRLNILVDQDHDGQLFQIFSMSVHPRNTLFLEVIERLGARTFGSGNIKALYEAVEAQRRTDLADDRTGLAA